MANLPEGALVRADRGYDPRWIRQHRRPGRTGHQPASSRLASQARAHCLLAPALQGPQRHRAAFRPPQAVPAIRSTTNVQTTSSQPSSAPAPSYGCAATSPRPRRSAATAAPAQKNRRHPDHLGRSLDLTEQASASHAERCRAGASTPNAIFLRRCDNPTGHSVGPTNPYQL
jgi:hypothetical protein